MILAAGALLAIGAAFGPVWVIRAGILIAIIAGVLATVLVWRQVRAEQQRRSRDVVEQAHAHGAALHTERNQHLSVLTTMESYNKGAADKVRTLGEQIDQLRGQLATQQQQLAQVRGDNVALTATISKLRTELSAREAEVRALTDDDAELLALPRRVATRSDWDALPKAEDIWADGDHPTVVDLQTLALGGEEQPERRQA
ncbi:MAG: hypothetical protein Q4F67_16370 [Propionibacteriaceae bacterium]|nr:hypothetical protein [Propionibacteriaceae bacterium]